MISYAPFWQTLKERNMTQYRLIRYHSVSPGQLDRMRKDMYISTRTMIRLCEILNCKPNDICEVKTSNK